MKILLSIKPEYSEKIFSGKKKYEFRKQKPKMKIDKVFVYESAPTKTIVGSFKIKRVISGNPMDIWKRCKTLGGIDKKEYLQYCNGNQKIYAFEIGNVFRFDNPIDPYISNSKFMPPQNFFYFDDSAIRRDMRFLEEYC